MFLFSLAHSIMASSSQEPQPSTSNAIVDNAKPSRDKQKDVKDVKLALKEYLKDVRGE